MVVGPSSSLWTTHALVQRLAKPNPDERDISHAAGLDARALEALLAHADAHRVLVPVGKSLLEGLGPERLSVMQHCLQRRIGLREELFTHMRHGAREFVRLGLRAAFVKGFGTEFAYGMSYRRQIYDLDVAVPDLDTFWRAAVALLVRGFQLDGMVLRRDPKDGHYFGAAALVCPSASDPNFHCRFDFMIGGQPLHWSSTMMFDDHFWKELQYPLTEPAVAVPSPRYAVLLLLGELLERRKPRIRDCLDLSSLARGLAPGDSTWLHGRMNALCLGQELRRLQAELPRDASVHSMPSAGGLFSPDQAGWSALLRILEHRPLRLALCHDLPLERRTRGLRAALAMTARNAARNAIAAMHAAGRHPEVLRSLSRRLDGRALLEAGSYVQLVLVCCKTRGPMRWHGRGKDSVLITPVGAFFPSPLAIMSAQEIARARTLASR